jgi:hypothetical protein
VPGVGDEKFAQWVRRDLLWLTVPALVAMLTGGGYVLLREPRLWDAPAYLRQLSWRRTALAVTAVAVLLVGRGWWLHVVGTHGEGPTGAQFLCEHTLAAIRGPLWGPVHHVVYYGPIVLVALLGWRRYFMNHGPYASDEMYLVHLGAALATAAVVAWLLRSPRRAVEPTAGDEDR